MNALTPQLPTILGSFSAMLIAFICLLNGTSSGTCLLRAAAAYLVFAGFGLILRYALTANAAAEPPGEKGQRPSEYGKGGSLDMILPGTSVADLLGTETERQEEIRQRPEIPE